MWAYLFSSQFYSMTIMNGSEEGSSPVTGSAFKAHMKDKEKQEKAKIVQEVANNKMAEWKDPKKEKKDKVREVSKVSNR